MFKHMLKEALRNLRRRKSYSILNIAGLSGGMACAILIFLWVGQELRFDRFHENADELYRVVGDDAIIKKTAVTCGPMAESLKNDYPEVLNATRYMPYAGSTFKYNNIVLHEEKGAFADPAFFAMFSFKIVSGRRETVLANPSEIVISESMARRFFGNEDPVGKAVLIDARSPLVVCAVVQDPPVTSQIQFNFVMNTLVLKSIGFPISEWSNAGLYTFIQVKKGTDVQKLNAQIADVMPRHISGFARRMFLQPLTDIHLNAEYASDLPGLGNMKYVYMFSAIGLFIILIACINYVTLSTSRVMARSKEVAVRKMVGSSRTQLVGYFLIESAIYVLVAAGIALALVEVSLPEFSRLSGTELVRSSSGADIWYGVAGVVCLICLLAGVYPAVYLSSLKPFAALKSLSNAGRKGTLVRKILVVVQFSLASILIIGTAIVSMQLDYVKNKQLGFDKSNVLYLPAKGEFLQHYDGMKQELVRQSSIVGVTAEDRLLMNASNSTDNLDWEGKDPRTYLNAEYSFVDRNYFEMLSVQILKGRTFSSHIGSDQDAYILNEEAVNQMKIEDPVGKRFSLNSKPGVIVGVIQNVNFRSLHQKIGPTVYGLLIDHAGLSFVYNGTILVKTAHGKTGEAIAAIGALWKEVNPDLPFDYHFLDEAIDNQYQKERHTGEIVSVFSMMAIFISCLGLYGLTSFMTDRRTKEIGVRKILGASVSGILMLLTNEFTKWILVANMIAWPVGYFIMTSWLRDFAYRVEITPWVFIGSGVLSLAIALLTVSAHVVRAARANPVETLRYEKTQKRGDCESCVSNRNEECREIAAVLRGKTEMTAFQRQLIPVDGEWEE